jgi:glycosyltransferase involved in cell wall biosynthesis
VATYPLVSAVIPTRNRPEPLRRAVASVISQDYPGEIECVVVFDQSEPVPIGLDVPPRREVRLITNGRSAGLAGARNSGVLTARGEFVGFCDDDDEWLTQKVRLQVDQLALDASIDVVASGTYVCRNGSEIARVPKESILRFGDFLRSRRMEIHQGTILVNRETFLDKIGLVDEAIPGGYGEDYDWMLRAARLNGISTISEPLARIHWSDGSWFVGRWTTLVSALEYLLEKYPEFHQEPVGLARIYGQIAFALAASGKPAEARAYAKRCLRLDARQPRAYLALLVATRVLRPNFVVTTANRLGRGI